MISVPAIAVLPAISTPAGAVPATTVPAVSEPSVTPTSVPSVVTLPIPPSIPALPLGHL